MHSDSVEKTAFVTLNGQWEFLRMLFGLVYPPVFQAVIKRMLKDLALVYADDVLTLSMNLNDTFMQLERILEAFRINNIEFEEMQLLPKKN